MAKVENGPETKVVDAEIVEPTPQQARQVMERVRPDGLLGLDLMTFAKMAVQSGYFPGLEQLSQAAMKIALGRDMGLGATTALRHLYVVRGRLGIQGEAMAAKIRDSGRYDYDIVEVTEEKAVLAFFRVNKAGEQIKKLGESSFTMAEAKRAGLVKSGSGWENFPSDMLFWRAMSRGQRRYCPDIFGGHTVYEKTEADEIPGEERQPAMVVRPGDLTLEGLRDATVTSQNDAPRPEEPKAPAAPKADAPAQADFDLSRF